MQKEILVMVKDAKYYQAQGSIVIIGVEVETRRPITQQITIMAFLENMGVFNAQEISTIINDHDRCKFLASQLRERKTPLKILFEDSKTEKDDI